MLVSEIVVTARPNQPADTIPFDASQRLDCVAAAGTLATLDIGETLVTAVPTNDPAGKARSRSTPWLPRPNCSTRPSLISRWGDSSTTDTPNAETESSFSAALPHSGSASPASTTNPPSPSTTTATS